MQIPFCNMFKIMKVLCVGSVPVTALSHSTDRPSLSLYCLLRLSNVVESSIASLNVGHEILCDNRSSTSLGEKILCRFWPKTTTRGLTKLVFSFPFDGDK
jgi:hypothetical protein